MTSLVQTARESALFLAGPLEITEVAVEPSQSLPSAVGAHIVSPSVGSFVLSMPSVVLAHRPFEVVLSRTSPCPGDHASVSVACCLITHAQLSVTFKTQSRGLVCELVSISVRPSGSDWIARALIRPALLADAVVVTVDSLALAGRPLTCDCLPVTRGVGYNHAPAPVGAVYRAASAGNVPALQAALDAGGSTEEADHVRRPPPFPSAHPESSCLLPADCRRMTTLTPLLP